MFFSPLLSEPLHQCRFSNPGGLDHQYDAARWLFEHGHLDEGLRWTEKILRDQPRHPKTNRLLADYYEKKGSHGRANFYQLQAKSEP